MWRKHSPDVGVALAFHHHRDQPRKKKYGKQPQRLSELEDAIYGGTCPTITDRPGFIGHHVVGGGPPLDPCSSMSYEVQLTIVVVADEDQ